jgi:tetratricopeptide (TPR) repeat protein
MRRTAYLGLILTFFLALAAPGFAQQINDPAEYKVYMDTVYNEKDPAKKAAGGEKYLTTYPNTVMRTQTYMAILISYYQTQNWAKVLEIADKQAQMAPTLSADDKKTVHLAGLTAAEGMKNTAKQKEYANKVLEGDPQNAGALVTLSGLLSNSIPTEEAAKAKHLDETLAITKRALATPRPAGATEAQWKPVLMQLHDTTCMVLLNQKKNAEAIAACQEALKLEKKDGYAYYLMGLAMKPAVADAIAKYKASVDKLNENRSADQLTRDELTATMQGLQSAATTKTDELIEVFAKSVATGWSGSANARNELKIFTGTPEELEKLIAAKKAELGVSSAN